MAIKLKKGQIYFRASEIGNRPELIPSFCITLQIGGYTVSV
jgi:hypothetical protein